ncbi:MAG: 30S ribosomal protein S9, partial [Syntrophobacterales bacterium]|nr:30S ribosomal protein S9 [Syntrophobacterales bacterium]
MAEKSYYATGKRKTSIARVWLKEGSGTLKVNKKNHEEYFNRESLKNMVVRPL